MSALDIDKAMAMQSSKRIFTPGPVPMFPAIQSLAHPQVPYFRNEEFSELVLEAESLLLELVGAVPGSRVLFLTCSGTGAMEACVQNFSGRGRGSLVINGGDFGQRFVDLHRRAQYPFSELIATGPEIDLEELVSSTMEKEVLYVNGHETSRGFAYGLEQIGKVACNAGALCVVDAISLFVTDYVDMDRQHIDALIISSHKGLALAPGLSMVVLSPLAQQACQQSSTLYFDFLSCLEDGARGQTPFTPAVQIMIQLHARLADLRGEGIGASVAHAAELAAHFRQGIEGLPLAPFTEGMPNAMTTLTRTDGGSARELVDALNSDYDIIVAPSGGDLKHKIFRVAHMGNMDTSDVDVLLAALKDYFSKASQL